MPIQNVLFTTDHHCQIFVGKTWGGQPPKNQSTICLLKMQCLQQTTIAKFLWVTIGEGSSKKSEQHVPIQNVLFTANHHCQIFVGKSWGGQPQKNQSNICSLTMCCLQQTTIVKCLWVKIWKGKHQKSRIIFAY